MPLPKPTKDQNQKDFMNDCMGDPTMNSEYPNQQQRLAVCYVIWRDRNKS